MDWLPDQTWHNIDGKLQDWDKMVVIKGWSFYQVGCYVGFDCNCCLSVYFNGLKLTLCSHVMYNEQKWNEMDFYSYFNPPKHTNQLWIEVYLAFWQTPDGWYTLIFSRIHIFVLLPSLIALPFCPFVNAVFSCSLVTSPCNTKWNVEN